MVIMTYITYHSRTWIICEAYKNNNTFLELSLPFIRLISYKHQLVCFILFAMPVHFVSKSYRVFAYQLAKTCCRQY